VVPVAGPVGDAARRSHLHVEVPNLFARRAIEREDFVRPGQIHHAVDGDGRDFEAAALRERVGPGLHEVRNVACVDLLERRIALTLKIMAIKRPVAGGELRLSSTRRKGKENAQAYCLKHPFTAHELNPPGQNYAQNSTNNQDQTCGFLPRFPLVWLEDAWKEGGNAASVVLKSRAEGASENFFFNADADPRPDQENDQRDDEDGPRCCSNGGCD